MTNDGKAESTDLREIETACHLAADAAEHVMRGDISRPNVPTLLVVLAATQNACRKAGNMFDAIAFDMEGHPELEAARPKATTTPRPARPSGDHRHKFGPDNVCAVPGCGKVKSANGRKPAASSGAVTGEVFIDTRTLPLAAARLVGDAAADRFADGGQGSSGVRR